MQKEEQVVYYVTPKEENSWWNKRYYKKYKAPKWEKVPNSEIEEVLRTHKFKFDTYPDNDCFHTIVEYDVNIKKKTVITEYI